jgi:hypothetical protein
MVTFGLINCRTMRYAKKDLRQQDREALIEIIEELQVKINKRNSELQIARTKLGVARSRVLKMKDTVQFQRKRILELHH